MSLLTPTTRLQRIAELRLELRADGSVRLRWEGEQLDAGPHALAIVEQFQRPVAFADAVERLRGEGRADWVALTGTVKRLFEAGVLRDVDGSPPPAVAGAGFGRPDIHIAMLNDEVRTATYLEAIREIVRPEDVVVDLGTGTGVLAMAAAQAGAAHVHAIETNQAIARVARSAFSRNGLADRITLHVGLSTGLRLPERADVLISEIIGDDPLAEHVLRFTSDAVERLLKDEARLVPARLAVYGLPVTVPPRVWRRHVVTGSTLESWRSRYGLDFSPLAEMRLSARRPLLAVRPDRASDWPVLGDPVPLASIDLSRIGDQRVDSTLTCTAREPGLLNGLLVYFEATLSPGRRLSTHPAQAGAGSSWRTPVWGADPPIRLQPGDRFTVRYQANVDGPGGRVRLRAGSEPRGPQPDSETARPVAE